MNFNFAATRNTSKWTTKNGSYKDKPMLNILELPITSIKSGG